jgi:hypothetical protein
MKSEVALSLGVEAYDWLEHAEIIYSALSSAAKVARGIRWRARMARTHSQSLALALMEEFDHAGANGSQAGKDRQQMNKARLSTPP